MKIELENAAAAIADSDNLTLEAARVYRELLYRRRVELQTLKDAIKSQHRENGVEDRWALTLATLAPMKTCKRLRSSTTRSSAI